MPAAALPPDLRYLDRGWLSSSMTVCLGGGGDNAAVIDTGYVKDAARTQALVREILGAKALAHIAHTHLHSDHCGGTHALQTLWPQATTWVPEASFAAVRDWDESDLTYHATGQRCPRLRADRALSVGATVHLGQRDWKIHAAPGHDARAIFFLDVSDRILIAGDALWGTGVGVIFPEIEGGAHFSAYRNTLDAIESLQPAWVLPGHGPAIPRGAELDAAFAQARKRLAYFEAHPDRHAEYAAKVLVKYQLMDVERMEWSALLAWMDATPDCHRAHRLAAPDTPWDTWARAVVNTLITRGALLRQGESVLNV